MVRRLPETPTTEKMMAEMAANIVRGTGNLITSVVMLVSLLTNSVVFGSDIESISTKIVT